LACPAGHPFLRSLRVTMQISRLPSVLRLIPVIAAVACAETSPTVPLTGRNGPDDPGARSFSIAQGLPLAAKGGPQADARLLALAPAQAFVTRTPTATTTLVTFENVGNNQPVPTTEGAQFVGWLAIVDQDAGGSGDFAWEPSASTAIFWQSGAQQYDEDGLPQYFPSHRDIVFEQPVARVQIYYAGCTELCLSMQRPPPPAIDIKLIALDADGNELDSAIGSENYNANPAGGDPRGRFNRWDPLEVSVPANRIKRVRITGYDLLLGVDNVLFERANSAPVAEISGGPVTTAAGTAVTFNASAADPDGDSPLTLTWNFGDATSPENTASGSSATHTYALPGTYTVTFTATDPNGAQHSDAITVAVEAANVIPAAAYTGTPNPATVGAPLSFDGSASTDADGDPLTYSWDFGDGSPASSGVTTAHVYTAAGTYNATLTVNDGNGGTNALVQPIVIAAAPPPANGPPSASFTAPPSALEATSVSFNASASSDPEGAALTYTWNFGDGTPIVTTSNPTTAHTFANSGTHVVTLTVSDGPDGSSPAARPMSIVNAPPIVNAGADATRQSGQTFTLHGSFSDVAGDGPWMVQITWGDGSPATVLTRSATGAFTATHPCTVRGPSTVVVTVTDKDGGTGQDTLDLTCSPHSIEISITPKVLNPGKKNDDGLITVRVMRTSSFNPMDVVPGSVTLGDGSGSEAGLARTSDGSYDYSTSNNEAVFRFRRSALEQNGDLETGNQQLILRLAVGDGRNFEGSDTVKVAH
jgi:PKD repeat protein